MKYINMAYFEACFYDERGMLHFGKALQSWTKNFPILHMAFWIKGKTFEPLED